MVKRVKRFVVFLLFSFFYSLLASKNTEADSILCVVPKNARGKILYKGNETNLSINDLNENDCY